MHRMRCIYMPVDTIRMDYLHLEMLPQSSGYFLGQCRILAGNFSFCAFYVSDYFSGVGVGRVVVVGDM